MQVLHLKDMTCFALSKGEDGSIFMAGDAGIWQLVPTPWSQQAAALADAQEYTEALNYAAMMPSHQV